MNLDELLSKKIVSLPPVPSPIDRVDRELDAMWEALRLGWNDAEAVTRACMSNLLIYCDNRTQAENVRADLPYVLQEHPARVLLMWEEQESLQDDIAATVSIHFSRLNQGLQVLGEEVGVACSANADQRLPSVARALLIGDLPTALWWASSRPPASAGKLFDELVRVAEQLIFDSLGWLNPPKGILAMSQWMLADRGQHVVYNLAWRRLKPWRKLLRETLDPVVLPDAYTHATRLELQHGPHALPMTWLLVGWLVDRLGWRPTEGKLLSKSAVMWRFNAPQGTVTVQITRLPEGDPVLNRLDWHWQGQRPGQATFTSSGDRKLDVRLHGEAEPSRALLAPRNDRATLIAEQLAHRDRDRLYESALAISNAMATAVLR
ncbi:glucose-6-phosphate dehydrogenase assembly protein OpcA [Methylococcus sp. EFPC2]|uniref:glucose-6-phosphate dehydrogenase assembly protein OpcA n=1 Tax=Methylococcus sp. EFPC2 TaxID=2812648 RepID=UPI0019677FCC|nr:glucose-6-phosphate dehydrogenase assembly protein OpcA [Methylococcus sp. EFPC2]QSA98569.1 glucose-6-phosphate dehydrogenase assembly protein OpcA [Methylococcus sp. EFPC2]